jgi:ferredoxin-NADP reductase
MNYKTKILMIEFETHDTKKFFVEKPEGYNFKPGQATNLSINQDGWKDKERPFTFTSLNEDFVLEFTIKKYDSHNGVTKKLHELKIGDEVILSEPWGFLEYKGNGTFIAGGTGITPFISIFRSLGNEIKNNKLIYSNKKSRDIIFEKELKEIFKENLILTLSEEKNSNYLDKRIDKNFLKKHVVDFQENFYVCGPPKFTEDIKKILMELGAKQENIFS